MARQTSTKVTETPPVPHLPPADLRGLPPTILESEAKQVSEAATIMQDEANGDVRHRMIREASYGLYVRRGYVDGFELADWLQAESEVDHPLSGRTTN